MSIKQQLANVKESGPDTERGEYKQERIWLQPAKTK